MRPVVYFLRPIRAEGPVKIGYSSRPRDRLATYAAWSPIPLEIAATTPGDVELEGRFHALFRARHSHLEWFHAAPEITRAIEEIRAGTFDFSILPGPVCVRPKKFMSRESIVAGMLTRRLGRLEAAGITVPREISYPKNLYYFSPEEVAEWRVSVREFVLHHDPDYAARIARAA